MSINTDKLRDILTKHRQLLFKDRLKDEQLIDEWECSICFDTLYKPMIDKCGHICC